MTDLAREVVEAAIDELNDESEDGSVISKEPSTALMGPDSTVDSLSLVRLLVTVERLVEERAGRSVVVVDESAFETEQSPFATVDTLSRHLARLLA